MSEMLSRMSGLEHTGIIAAAVIALLLVVCLLLSFRKKNRRPEDTRTKPVEAPLSYPATKHGGILIGNAQNIGARKDQQDSFGLSAMDAVPNVGLLAVVADGMGGLNNGAVYSKTAVQAALQSFRDERAEKSDEATLLRVLKRAREAVDDTGLTDGGTTFVAALIRNQKLHFISVGDSRICLMRNGGLIQLNREHIYGRELDDLAANGMLSEEEAAADSQRAAITSYLGKREELAVDRNINAISLFSGDKIALMSDGVYNYMPETELTALLCRKPMEAAEAVEKAILAKNNLHQDNITIIVLEIE